MTMVAQSALIETGLVANDFLLDLNRTLAAKSSELPAPWNLPSRLFQFPIEVGEANPEGLRAIGLMHRALREHPHVQRVAELVGSPLSPNGSPNAHGVSNQHNGQWWHAVDLISSGHWRELLETRHFTLG